MQGTKNSRIGAWLCAVAICAAGLLMPTSKAGAQLPKTAQKWQYARLHYYEAKVATGEHVATVATWQVGKKYIYSPTKKLNHESLAKLYKDLGGKEQVENVNEGVALLLDQIGQEGWELVANTRTEPTGGTPGGWRSIETWTFKRPAQ